jgi:hypothetical protein
MNLITVRQRPVVDRLLQLCDETGAVMAAVQDNSIDERVRIPEAALTKLRVLKKEISLVLENA